MLVERGGGARGAEALHPHEHAAGADPPFPAEAAGRFAGDAGGHGRRKHALPVGGILLLEEIPARHAHHAGVHALLGELHSGIEADLYLAPRADQDAVGLPVGRILEGVGTAGRTASRAVACRAVERGDVLPREHDDRGTIAPLHHHAVGLGHLVGIARTEHREAGHRAGAGKLLDRLVRGAVLTEPDRVVGEHVDHAELPEGREP